MGKKNEFAVQNGVRSWASCAARVREKHGVTLSRRHIMSIGETAMEKIRMAVLQSMVERMPGVPVDAALDEVEEVLAARVGSR